MPVVMASVSGLFFDRVAVSAAVDRGTLRAFSKFGAFVRQRARSSIRRAGKRATARAKAQGRSGPVSAPGSPPLAHAKGLGIKTILFSYDPAKRSVVIGPILLPAAKGQRHVGTTVPKLLEEGGTTVIVSPSRLPSERRQGIKTKRQARYAPRPFMAPAFQAELPRAASLFENTVR